MLNENVSILFTIRTPTGAKAATARGVLIVKILILLWCILNG